MPFENLTNTPATITQPASRNMPGAFTPLVTQITPEISKVPSVPTPGHFEPGIISTAPPIAAPAAPSLPRPPVVVTTSQNLARTFNISQNQAKDYLESFKLEPRGSRYSGLPDDIQNWLLDKSNWNQNELSKWTAELESAAVAPPSPKAEGKGTGSPPSLVTFKVGEDWKPYGTPDASGNPTAYIDASGIIHNVPGSPEWQAGYLTHQDYLKESNRGISARDTKGNDVIITSPAVDALIKSLKSDPSGESYFNSLKELGIIPKGSQFGGIDKNGNLIYITGKEYRAQQAIGKAIAKENLQQAQNRGAVKAFEENLKIQPKELQEAYKKGGFKEYSNALERYNLEIEYANINALHLTDAESSAITKLQPYQQTTYLDKKNKVGVRGYDLDSFIHDNPTENSIKTLQNANFNEDAIKPAKSYVSSVDKILNNLDISKLKLSQADALLDAIAKNGYYNPANNGATLKNLGDSSNPQWVDNKTKKVLTSQEIAQRQWGNLSESEKRIVAGDYGTDLFKNSYFAEYTKQMSDLASKTGTAGGLVYSPILGITSPIAKQISGLKVSPLEWAVAGATAGMDFLALGGADILSGVLKPVVARGISEGIGVGSTAIFGKSLADNWSKMNNIEKFTQVGMLSFPYVADLGIKGGKFAFKEARQILKPGSFEPSNVALEVSIPRAQLRGNMTPDVARTLIGDLEKTYGGKIPEELTNYKAIANMFKTPDDFLAYAKNYIANDRLTGQIRKIASPAGEGAIKSRSNPIQIALGQNVLFSVKPDIESYAYRIGNEGKDITPSGSMEWWSPNFSADVAGWYLGKVKEYSPGGKLLRYSAKDIRELPPDFYKTIADKMNNPKEWARAKELNKGDSVSAVNYLIEQEVYRRMTLPKNSSGALPSGLYPVFKFHWSREPSGQVRPTWELELVSPSGFESEIFKPEGRLNKVETGGKAVPEVASITVYSPIEGRDIKSGNQIKLGQAMPVIITATKNAIAEGKGLPTLKELYSTKYIWRPIVELQNIFDRGRATRPRATEGSQVTTPRKWYSRGMKFEGPKENPTDKLAKEYLNSLPPEKRLSTPELAAKLESLDIAGRTEIKPVENAIARDIINEYVELANKGRAFPESRLREVINTIDKQSAEFRKGTKPEVVTNTLNKIHDMSHNPSKYSRADIAIEFDNLMGEIHSGQVKISDIIGSSKQLDRQMVNIFNKLREGKIARPEVGISVIDANNRLTRTREPFYHPVREYADNFVVPRAGVMLKHPTIKDAYIVVSDTSSAEQPGVWNMIGGQIDVRGQPRIKGRPFGRISIQEAAREQVISEVGVDLKDIKPAEVHMGKTTEHSAFGTYMFDAKPTNMNFKIPQGKWPDMVKNQWVYEPEIGAIRVLKSGDSAAVTPALYIELNKRGFDTSNLTIVDKGLPTANMKQYPKGSPERVLLDKAKHSDNLKNIPKAKPDDILYESKGEAKRVEDFSKTKLDRPSDFLVPTKEEPIIKLRIIPSTRENLATQRIGTERISPSSARVSVQYSVENIPRELITREQTKEGYPTESKTQTRTSLIESRTSSRTTGTQRDITGERVPVTTKQPAQPSYQARRKITPTEETPIPKSISKISTHDSKLSDPQKRSIIASSEGAVYWPQGKLHNKVVYHTVFYPYTENQHLTVVGKKPDGAKYVSGPAKALKYAQSLYGPAPEQGTVKVGFEKVSISPGGGEKVRLTFRPTELSRGHGGRPRHNPRINPFAPIRRNGVGLMTRR